MSDEMSDEEFVRWLGGFLDGEGCFTLCGKNVMPFVEITNTSWEMLRDINARFPGTLVVAREATKRHKKAWVWCVTGTEAVKFSRMIRPYLRLKIPQAELLGQCSVGYQGRPRRGCSHTPSRRGIEARIRHYNRRGPAPDEADVTVAEPPEPSNPQTTMFPEA